MTHHAESFPASRAASGLGRGHGAAAPAAWAETPADTLVVAAQIDDIISLDPGQSFEFSGQDVVKNLYDRLVDFDPLDLNAGIKPSLAEAWRSARTARPSP